MINKYLNTILSQTSKALGCEVGIIEGNGTVVSSGKSTKIEEYTDSILESCAMSKNKLAKMYDSTFFTVTSRGRVDYVTFIERSDEAVDVHAEILSSYIGGIRQMHSDKYDRSNFVKNMLSDSVLPSDVFLKSKELHLTYDETHNQWTIRRVAAE